MLPKVDARPKVFFVWFFSFGFFSALCDFFSKIFGFYQRVPPLHFFLSFRFVKTFNGPEWPFFEFFGIRRLLKNYISKKNSEIIFLKKKIFQMFPIVVP